MDQPKNHRRIIALVAAIGASKASASRFNASVYRLRRQRFTTGTSMSGKLSPLADTRTVITGWSWRRARMDGPRGGGVSEDAPALRPRAVHFYTLRDLFPALRQAGFAEAATILLRGVCAHGLPGGNLEAPARSRRGRTLEWQGAVGASLFHGMNLTPFDGLAKEEEG